MAVDGQKRFRKRGGAKKKKKNTSNVDTLNDDTPNFEASSEQTTQLPPRQPPQQHTQQQYPDTAPRHYVSGFSDGPSSQSGWQGNLDSDLQSYLEKLQADLEDVDPGAEAASAYLPHHEDPPQSVLLARNALTELSPRLPELSRDNNAARFIEILLRIAKSQYVLSAALDALLAIGPSRFADLAAHRCASHVLEKLLTSMRDLGGSFDSLGPIVSAWTADDITNVISSPSGSHVFRAIASALSGLPNDEPRQAKLDDSNPQKITSYLDSRDSVSDESLEAVVKMANTLLEAGTNLHDMAWQSSSSTALQGLLSAVTVADKSIAKKLGAEFLKAGFSNLVNDAAASRLLERMILCLGTSIVAGDMKGGLAELATHPKGNFAVQRYLLGLKGRGAVMSAWDELEESIPHMLGFGRSREGVVLSLLRVTEAQGDENCRRRASRAVARACGAVGTKAKNVMGILIMGSEVIWEKWRTSVESLGLTGMGIHGRGGDIFRSHGRLVKPSLLGTLIFRCMMRFPGGPGQASRDSMAALSSLEILAMIADPCGSRVVEQWIQDEKTERGAKIACKIFKVVWDSGEAVAVQAVARNPYGAMVIVRCSAWLDGPHRKQLMDSLASDFHNLKNHGSGQIVMRKCRVEHYMRKGEQWEQEESTKRTRQRLFAEILEDEDESQDNEDAGTRRKKKAEAKVSKKRKRPRNDDANSSHLDTEGEHRQGKTSVATGAENNGVPEETPKSQGTKESETTLKSVLNAIESASKPKKKKKKSKLKGKIHAEHDTARVVTAEVEPQ